MKFRSLPFFIIWIFSYHIRTDQIVFARTNIPLKDHKTIWESRKLHSKAFCYFFSLGAPVFYGLAPARVFVFTFLFCSIKLEISSSRWPSSSNIFISNRSKYGKNSAFSFAKIIDNVLHFSFSFLRAHVRLENLSNQSCGVQISWDICTRLGCYLYSTE